MTEEVKACPFCGGKPHFENEGSDYGFYAVCSRCGCWTGALRTKDESLKRWNNRPIEDELSEKIKKLEAENDALKREILEAREDNCENMEYHVAERERLRELLKFCCNEFAPRNSNYPVCSRANWCVDAKGHCFERKECPIYAELTKGEKV